MKMQHFPGWARPVILGCMVYPVLNFTNIRFPGLALFLVVAAVLYYRLNLFPFQIGVVFFAAITCIRNDCLWQYPEDLIPAG